MVAGDLESRQRWRDRTHRRGWGWHLLRWRRWTLYRDYMYVTVSLLYYLADMEEVNWKWTGQDENKLSNFPDPILQFRLLGWVAEGKVNQAGRRWIVSSLCQSILVTFSPSVISSLFDCWVVGILDCWSEERNLLSGEEVGGSSQCCCSARHDQGSTRRN